MNAIRVHRTGGPEVLSLETAEAGAPAAGEIRIRHRAIGVNFIDIYHRTGFYPQVLPFVPGVEGAGVVEAVGAGVDSVRIGERIVYAGGSVGAYSEARLIPAELAIRLPPHVSEEEAASGMLRALTAYVLLHRTCPVKAGDTVLIHAAAGGTGLLLCQWASALGARVIGTVSSKSKAALARLHGCAFPVVTAEEDFVDAVRTVTGGEGVSAVYDSVGADTFLKSLECLRPLGILVTFGQSSGAAPLVDVGLLARKGSLFLTRPSVFTYLRTRAELEEAAAAVFDAVRERRIRWVIGQRYPLREAAEAHRALESRRTTGSTILTVGD